MNAAGPYWSQVNIGTGNGLMPPGSKPLPEPIMTWFNIPPYDVTRPQWVKQYQYFLILYTTLMTLTHFHPWRCIPVWSGTAAKESHPTVQRASHVSANQTSDLLCGHLRCNLQQRRSWFFLEFRAMCHTPQRGSWICQTVLLYLCRTLCHRPVKKYKIIIVIQYT